MKSASTVPRLSGGQSAYRKKTNWLLRSLIIGSIGLHTIAFFYLAGIYRSRNMTVIELSLRNESAPQRNIPRPRLRQKPKLPDKINPVVPRQPAPSIKPIRMSPVEADLPDGIAESINDTFGVIAPPTGVQAWDPAIVPGFSVENFDSPDSYLEMVRFRIEKNKLYPEKAKRENMRGRVILTLIITLDGEVASLSVQKSSGYPMLDDAALSAVRRAMPFPVPPTRFFKKDIFLNIPILFEIT